MRVDVQDALLTPENWRSVDSRDYGNEPAKPAPVGGEIIDGQKGWGCRLCVQGIRFTSDHNAVKHLIDGCEVTSWSDDPDDEQDHPLWSPNDPQEWWFRAHVVRFRDLAPDPNLGGAINTNTTRILYAGRRIKEEWEKKSPQGYHNLIIRPWEEFIPPAPNITRHGIWLPDDLHAAHEKILSRQNWRAWGEKLDPAELDANGLVKAQYEQGRMSPPKGTTTYFLRDTDQASAVHVTATSTNENAMSGTAGASETETSSNLAASEDNLEFLWTTVSGAPNDGDWPNGLYECQTDCSAIDGDVSYGLLTLGGSAGHFANVNFSLSTDNESWTQDQGAFTAATLNLASHTIDPASGAAGDRFECLVAGARAAGCHGNQTFTMQYTSDAFARGPWVAAADESEDAGIVPLSQPVIEPLEIIGT